MTSGSSRGPPGGIQAGAGARRGGRSANRCNGPWPYEGLGGNLRSSTMRLGRRRGGGREGRGLARPVTASPFAAPAADGDRCRSGSGAGSPPLPMQDPSTAASRQLVLQSSRCAPGGVWCLSGNSGGQAQMTSRVWQAASSHNHISAKAALCVSEVVRAPSVLSYSLFVAHIYAHTCNLVSLT